MFETTILRGGGAGEAPAGVAPGVALPVGVAPRVTSLAEVAGGGVAPAGVVPDRGPTVDVPPSAVTPTPVASTPVATPADLARAVVAAVRGLFSGADAAFAAQWDDEQRVVVLAELDRVSELVGVYRGRVLAAHRAQGRWARQGDRSFEAWRGRTTGQGSGAARSEVELADGLTALPEAAKAVETGEASLGHVRVLTRLRAGASAPVKRALEDGGAAALLADAAAAGWDAPTFTKRAQAWAASVDTDAVERSFAAVRERRYARVVDRDGGCAVEAFLDPVAGAAFRTALEALSPAPSPGDERTADQRRADALARLGERVLQIGDDRLGAQIRPHLTLLVPADAWTGIQRRKQARASTRISGGDGGDPAGAGGESVGAGVGAAPAALAELDDGTVVPPSELERLMCDCEVTRLVLDADGVPLDVGQTQRTYTKELRRAILARDGHCQWPGCTTRASWCEVHHIRWYTHGGPTSLTNGLTLCSFHHHQIHRGTATLHSVETGVRFVRRDGAILGQTTRAGGARRLAGTKRRAGGAGGGEVGGLTGAERGAGGEELRRGDPRARPVSSHGAAVLTMRIDRDRSVAPATTGARDAAGARATTGAGDTAGRPEILVGTHRRGTDATGTPLGEASASRVRATTCPASTGHDARRGVPGRRIGPVGGRQVAAGARGP